MVTSVHGGRGRGRRPRRRRRWRLGGALSRSLLCAPQPRSCGGDGGSRPQQRRRRGGGAARGPRSARGSRAVAAAAGGWAIEAPSPSRDLSVLSLSRDLYFCFSVYLIAPILWFCRFYLVPFGWFWLFPMELCVCARIGEDRDYNGERVTWGFKLSEVLRTQLASSRDSAQAASFIGEHR